MGIFNRETVYEVRFHAGVQNKKNIFDHAAKNQAYLISSTELTKQNEKELLKELQSINDNHSQNGDFLAKADFEKIKLKKSDRERPLVSFEEMHNSMIGLTNSVWQSVYKQIQARSNQKHYTQQEYKEKVVPQILEAMNHQERNL